MISADSMHIPSWDFSCSGCGNCCRRWHVALLPADREKLQALDWRPESPPEPMVTFIAGHPYLAHRQDGTCVFLDSATNRCRIHQRFGFRAKPLGCRVYPFNITSTVPGQFSMICRFDCPSVRQRQGAPVRDSLRTVLGYAEEMRLFSAHGADASMRAGLAPETLCTLTVLLSAVLRDRRRPLAAVLIQLAVAIERLEGLGGHFLNSVDLAEIMPSLLQRSAEMEWPNPGRRLGFFAYSAFLSLFTGYLRRDEEVIGQGILPRLQRMRTLFGFYLYRGNPRGLGLEHPDFSATARQVFQTPLKAQPDALDLYRAFLLYRLESLQFFGSAVSGLDYFSGWRALLLSGPLVLAAARWSALARAAASGDSPVWTAADTDYALGAIDHGFGRSAYLNLGPLRAAASLFAAPAAYARLTLALVPAEELNRGASLFPFKN